MTPGSSRNIHRLFNSTPPDSPAYLCSEWPWAMDTPEGGRGRALPLPLEVHEGSSARLALPSHPGVDKFHTPSRAGNVMQTRTPPDSGLRLARNDQVHTARVFPQARQDRSSAVVWNATALGVSVAPHPHGNIGDGRLSPVQETTSISSRPRTLIPFGPLGMRCEPCRQPTVPGKKHSSIFAEPYLQLLAQSTENNTNTAPVSFRPMSSLGASATGQQYVPDPSSNLDAVAGEQQKQQQKQQQQQTAVLNVSPTTLTVARPRPGNHALFTDVDRIAAGFSPRYMGDILLRNNQSEDIADDQNCSLFIVNLPAGVTTHDLLAAVHRLGPTGRVYATHINGPEPARGHPGCAAKVVFFKRDVAHAFHERCAALGVGVGVGGDNNNNNNNNAGHHTGGPGFLVNGQMTRVMWNRIRTSERALLADTDASRVLLIAGPPAFVNERALTAFFRSKLEFQVDSVITHVAGAAEGAPAVVEYRFGSYRCQAQAARLALQREMPHVDCFFGSDPLEPCAWKPFEYYSLEKGY